MTLIFPAEPVQTVYNDTANSAALALFLTQEAEHTVAQRQSGVSAADRGLSSVHVSAFTSTRVV